MKTSSILLSNNFKNKCCETEKYDLKDLTNALLIFSMNVNVNVFNTKKKKNQKMNVNIVQCTHYIFAF